MKSPIKIKSCSVTSSKPPLLKKSKLHTWNCEYLRKFPIFYLKFQIGFQFISGLTSIYTLAFYTFDYIKHFYLYHEYKYFPLPLELRFQRSFFCPELPLYLWVFSPGCSGCLVFVGVFFPCFSNVPSRAWGFCSHMFLKPEFQTCGEVITLRAGILFHQSPMSCDCSCWCQGCCLQLTMFSPHCYPSQAKATPQEQQSTLGGVLACMFALEVLSSATFMASTFQTCICWGNIRLFRYVITW